MLLAEGASLPRLALRRRGLLSLLIREKPAADAKETKGAEEDILRACRSVAQDEPLLREDEAPASMMRCESPPAMLREPADIGSLADRRARYLVAWRSDDAVNEIKFRAGEKLAAKTESALKYRIADHLQRYFELESSGRAALKIPWRHDRAKERTDRGRGRRGCRRWELVRPSSTSWPRTRASRSTRPGGSRDSKACPGASASIHSSP
jgi:hypothetical protein